MNVKASKKSKTVQKLRNKNALECCILLADNSFYRLPLRLTVCVSSTRLFMYVCVCVYYLCNNVCT